MKKSQLIIILGGAVLIIAIVGVALAVSFKTKISKEEAIDIAYKYASVKKENIKNEGIKKDRDDNSYVVKFQDEIYKYELEIDANSGRVLDYEREPISENLENKPVDAKLITEKEAKEIALTDAKVSEKKVKFIKTKLEKDYGILVYEIEFISDSFEYEYKIGAHDGKKISYSKEEDDPINNTKPTNQKYITKEKAKEIALKHSKLNASDVTFEKVEFDYDNGIATYEVEFIYNYNEYDYEIKAVDGNIIQFKVER